MRKIVINRKQRTELMLNSCPGTCRLLCVLFRLYMYSCMYSHLYVQSPVCTVTCMYSHLYVQSPVCTVTCMYSHLYVQSPVCTVICMYSHLYVQSPVCTVCSLINLATRLMAIQLTYCTAVVKRKYLVPLFDISNLCKVYLVDEPIDAFLKSFPTKTLIRFTEIQRMDSIIYNLFIYHHLPIYF